MADLSGQQLGNYRLLRVIGKGGFAEVYLGEHIYLGTTAAVKVLQARLVSDEERDAFCNEARTIAHLAHHHILRVLDFDVEENIPFLITDYAPNGTLRERYPKTARMPLPQVVDYVEQIADALQYAHDHNVVHRDIKPENILLGEQDEVLLSDFGIAVIVHSTSTQLPEKVIGTGVYMAPEQFRGKVYPASDQYALAVMVYEWLSGEYPFQGTFIDLYQQHTNLPPPPLSEKLSTTPLALETVLLRALEKEPARRFPTVSNFAYALAEAVGITNKYNVVPRKRLTEESQHSGSSLDDTIPPDMAIVGLPVRVDSLNTSSQHAEVKSGQDTPDGVLETAAPSTMAARLLVDPSSPTQRSTPRAVVDYSVSSYMPTQPIVIRKRSRRRFIGGALVVGLGVLGAAGGIFIPPYITRYFQSTSPALYTYRGHKDLVWSVAWSPDSKRLASASKDMTVQLWDATTGEHMLPFRGHSRGVRAVAWSPDGQQLASGSEDHHVVVWSANSLVRDVIYDGHTNTVVTVAWSPDGRRIASGGADTTVQIWEPDGGQSIALTMHSIFKGTKHTAPINAVAWSPNGKYIASASEDTTICLWNAANGKLLRIYSGHARSVRAVAWSPDSRLLASGSADTTVQVWQASTGKNIYTYTGHAAKINTLSWSPNGKRIVSGSDYVPPSHDTGTAPAVNNNTVQIWDAMTGRNVYNYKGHESSVTSLAWSVQGNYIASASLDNTVQVWKPA